MESTDNVNNLSNSAEETSVFTGRMLANYFIGLATILVSLITLGLAYPAMVCWKLKWKASHTYLNGRQLAFDGNAMQLMGKYVLWMFLSLITFGLYYIFSAELKLTEWEIKHTHFSDYISNEENKSIFNGKWYQLFAINFVCRFVTIITLFIGYYWAHCYKERWYCKHKTIDGYELEFDGTGMQYFGKRIVWTLLTIITFGIYSFWLQIKSVKWTVSHTKLSSLIDWNGIDISASGRQLAHSGLMMIIKDDKKMEVIKVIDGKAGIKTEMFYECKNLCEIIIPNGVAEIGDRAFGFCSSLTKVYIPLSVTRIGDMAFDGCGKVKIYCIAEAKPEGWSSTWNHCNYPVVWGYKGD